MIPIKPENAAKINFDPSAFFLKPFHLLISLLSRTRLQIIRLQKRDVKTFWVSFVNIVSTFFPYFELIQAQDGLHTNIGHLRLLWTSMVYICNTLPISPKIKAICKKITTNSNIGAKNGHVVESLFLLAYLLKFSLQQRSCSKYFKVKM